MLTEHRVGIKINACSVSYEFNHKCLFKSLITDNRFDGQFLGQWVKIKFILILRLY